MTEPTTAAEPAEDARVLLVDDDATSLAVLRRTLEGRGYHLFATRSGEQAIEVARRARPLLVLMDVMMPGVDGYEACRRLKADPATRDAAVLFLSSLDDARDKVRGLEVGAVDFITKPFQAEEVVARVNAHLTIARLRRQLEARNADLARELAVAEELLADARRRAEGPLVGSSPAVRALRESIAAEAGRAEPLLLTGSPGSGVEASARAIHHASPRAAQAFLHVNCGLLSGSRDAGLLPGPGTGGGAPRLSLLEVAERGTLFLEEVQRLPAEEQERLAAVIEAAEAAREKGAVPAPDVRVLASSSGALEASAGFHPRLLARLEARQLRVPALAERAEDVPELAQFFVRQHARRVGSVAERVSEASVRRLQRYRWPGGVRELSSLLERAVASARGPVVEIDPGLLDEGLPLGSYRLLEKLGAGGMGEVWRARHQLLARPCAVKLVRPELLGETGREQALERFGREARTIARLGSPHTVRLYDFGVSETGNPYFVARRGAPGGAPPPRRQAPERPPVPARHRVRRGEGARLRPRQVDPRRRRADHRRRRGHRHPGLHAARARGGGAGGRAVRPLLAGLRRVLPAHRPAGLHGRADGRDDPPRPLDPGSAVGGLRVADPRGPRGGGAGVPPEGPREPPGLGPGRRRSAGPASGRRRGGASTRPRRRRPPTPTRATAWTARRAERRRHAPVRVRPQRAEPRPRRDSRYLRLSMRSGAFQPRITWTGTPGSLPKGRRNRKRSFGPTANWSKEPEAWRPVS